MKIDALPHAVEVPANDELVVPVFLDHSDLALRKISVSVLGERIRDAVLEGGGILMIETDQGIRFERLVSW